MAQTLCDGLVKEIRKEGTGTRPNAGDTITVHCTGMLQGNPPKKFWSTKDAGQKPFTFRVGMGEVISGWDDGCMSMAVGEQARLTIAGHKGYGAAGFPAWGITPNATLLFDIEILSIGK